MNRWLLAVALMTTALAGPVAMPTWAAQEIQIVRKGDEGGTQMLPFTTYQKEIQAAMKDLPCKWVSMDGRLGPSYGSGRYDFLCKGGDWATVSLFLDKSSSGGVSRVRLSYREWKDNVHPNAGEAFIAQQFLQHVMNRFVPASVAGKVMEGFWQDRSQDWAGDGVKIGFKVDISRDDYHVRMLEVVGTANAVSVAPVVVAPQPLPITAQPVKMVPVPVVTPTDAGLSKAPALAPLATPQIQEPAVVLPQAPLSLPVPQNTGAPVTPVQTLQVPADAPAAQISSTLIKATPAELNTAPAPESLAKPAPLPPVSNSLIPSPEAAIIGREQAPSNFDAYNRAVELTKDIEKKAMIVAPDKVKSVAPVATPQVKAQATASKPDTKQVPVGIDRERDPNAELGLPKDATVAAPQVPQDPRFEPVRPLPQLKFIPKAEPLPESQDPIQFEDSGSGL